MERGWRSAGGDVGGIVSRNEADVQKKEKWKLKLIRLSGWISHEGDREGKIAEIREVDGKLKEI